jgi:ATP-dependent DNA ligase
VRKLGDHVRIYIRRGADWTHRFPLIVRTAAKLKAKSLYLDGEGVVSSNFLLGLPEPAH